MHSYQEIYYSRERWKNDVGFSADSEFFNLCLGEEEVEQKSLEDSNGGEEERSQNS